MRISINENAMKTNEHILIKKKIDFFASVYVHIFVSSMYMIFFRKNTRLVLIFLPLPPNEFATKWIDKVSMKLFFCSTKPSFLFNEMASL